MTETSISLISILVGIAGANLAGFLSGKYNFGLTGNSIIGVFGGVLFLKGPGKLLSLDPVSIMETGQVNTGLLILNVALSLVGGALTVILAAKVKTLLGY